MQARGNIKNGNGQFLTENIWKLLLRFSIPAILSLLVAEMYNMVDSLFVGQVVGAKGIGALTIAFPIQRLFVAISMLVAIGATTAVARSNGENDYKAIRKIIPNALFILTAIILVLSIGIFIFIDSVIMKLGSSETIFPYAKSYISIILVGVLFQGLTILISYTLTSFGDAKIVLLSTAVGAICNIIIDYLLVIIFHLGVTGAAMATVISQLISFLYAYIKFVRYKKETNLKLEFKLEKSIFTGIILVGFSTFVIEISDAVVSVILNKMLIEIGGDTAIVAVGLITRISMFLFMTIIGISSSMQTIAAYNFGAGSHDRVRKIVKLSMKFVTISSIVLWAVMMIFTKQIIGIFVNDPEIIKYTVNAFRIVVSVIPCVGVYYVAIYYYQAMGMAKLSFLLSISRQIIIFIPTAYIMVYSFGLGVIGAWIAYPISDVISFVISIIYINYYQLEDMKTEQVKEKGRIVTA